MTGFATSVGEASRVTASWRRRTVTTADGIELAVWLAGPDSGRPHLFAHGLSDNGRCWWRVIDALLQAAPDALAIAPDARNHGDSGTGPNHAERLLADVVAVLDALGIDRTIAIGHSLGARTVAEVAATSPTRVRSLVLVDPPWSSTDAGRPDERRAEIAAWLQSIRSMPADRRAARGPVDHPEWPEAEYEPWAESSGQVRLEAADLSGAAPWSDVIERLRCPTLLVHGEPELGGIVTDRVADEIVRRQPLITTRRVAGSGHHPHRERFEAFVHEVADALRMSPGHALDPPAQHTADTTNRSDP